MSKTVKKCRAKQWPCRAGARCPEHGMITQSDEYKNFREAVTKLFPLIEKQSTGQSGKVSSYTQPTRGEIDPKNPDLFRNPTSCQVPADAYPEFHAAVCSSLDAAGAAMQGLRPRSMKRLPSFDGRPGATAFEKEYLKPLIREHYTQLIDSANESLSGGRFEVVGFLDFELLKKKEAKKKGKGSDSSNRLFEDLVLVMQDKILKKRSYVPINIKATTGTAADNIGGWASLQYALRGWTPNNSSREHTLFNSSEKESIATKSAADYYLWSFIKDPTKATPFLRSHSYSLMEFSPFDFTYNQNQSFPIQASVKKLMDVRTNNPNTAPLNERRQGWVDFLKERMFAETLKTQAKLFKFSPK